MVSTSKRMHYNISDNDFSTSGEETQDEVEYSRQRIRKVSKLISKDPKNLISSFIQTHSKSGSKLMSRNALMARENRLKKKIYLEGLENQVGQLKSENEKFSKILDNQSLLISDLKKEIKYLRSALANSTDIGNLVRNIHNNTGMSVRTSLGQSLSLKNDYLSKPKQPPVARKTAHPWDEDEMRYPNYPTPEQDLLSPSPTQDDLLLNNFQLNELLGDTLLDTFPIAADSAADINQDLLKEHNYTSQDLEDNLDDVGVCLHVSKHRVSLEFCSKCSDTAQGNWTTH